MNAMLAKDPTSGVVQTFTDEGALTTAIGNGFTVLRSDGVTPAVTQFLQQWGGYVVDGAPLNVLMEGVWFSGQQADMAPLWSSGQVPTPSAAILALPTVAMPTDIAANTAAYQASVSGSGGISSNMLLIGAGLAAVYMFTRH